MNTRKILYRVAQVLEFLFFVALLVLICTGFFKSFPWWNWVRWIIYPIMVIYGIGLISYLTAKRKK
jgi:hypothetical protein